MNIAWKEPYLDKIRWILAHLNSLNLDPQETLIVLLIQYMTETGEEITHKSLSAKSGLAPEAIEEIFVSLSARGMLGIDLVGGRMAFVLDGLAEQTGIPAAPGTRSLLDAFEQELGRGLSPVEMQRILDLAGKYNERRVIAALNEAVAYDKVSINYVENVLAAWNRKGYSIEDVENGRR